ncbi:hypothetical protein [Daejeonella sp.]|uniref:hypothetical protein n=1 Tax=Daejeonella sp. TaxID=2805397 RepID=UPI0030BCC322
MPPSNTIHVKDLKLDLRNFRTVPQPNEHSAIKSFITIKPDKFWALVLSLLDDGYIPTENIIVLREADGKLIVKEGNRRVGAIKLILGKIQATGLTIPANIVQRIGAINTTWKRENGRVPCSIYDMADYAKVERIVSRTHAKSEAAGRDPWNSVARARYNRDMAGTPEPGLDLLEKYLENGQNITTIEKERWSGDYSLTVLDEALKKLLPRLGLARISDLVRDYPTIVANRSELEDIMRDIGGNVIGFPAIRHLTDDVFTKYGIPPTPPPVAPSPTASTGATAATGTTSNPVSATAGLSTGPTAQSTPTGTPSTGTQLNSASTPTPVRGAANYSITDQRHVKALLRTFTPRGNNRQKVVTLRDEARKLDLTKTPIAFCFLLRSMFEISAKEYSNDNNLPTSTSRQRNGQTITQDKSLAELLNQAKNHLTTNNTDHARIRVLHSAITELTKPQGILSVTSLNQLVHSPTFYISPSDLCILFGNVFPLLNLMN